MPEDASEVQPTFLTYGLEDGTEHTVPVATVKDGLRVAIGGVNRRSSVWRATTWKDEVYLTAGGLGQALKFSLHSSGIWRLAYLSAEHAERYGATGLPEYSNDPRLLDRWEAPEPDNGWMHALTVIVPHGHLSDMPEEVENPKKPILLLPEADPGELVALHFAVVRPDEGTITTQGMGLVAAFQLNKTRALVVLASRRAVSEHEQKWFDDIAIAAAAKAAENGIEAFDDPMRIGLFQQADNGNRRVMDLRMPTRERVEAAAKNGLKVNLRYQPPDAPE